MKYSIVQLNQTVVYAIEIHTLYALQVKKHY